MSPRRAAWVLATLVGLGAAPLAAGETPVNGCILADAVNWLHLGPAPRHVDFVCCEYDPPCVKIKPGRTVRWLGDFSFHPLRPGKVVGAGTQSQPGNPIPALDAGTDSGQISFPQPGVWGYYCNFHWSTDDMYGAVIVAVFADGFENGNPNEWSLVVH